MKKNIFLFIIVFIVSIGMCGCNVTTKPMVSDKQAIAEMELHLLDKYGFLPYQYVNFLPQYDCDILNLVIEIDGINELFSVKRYQHEDSYTCTDNYFGLIVRERFENKISEYAQNHFPEYKVYAYMTSVDYPNSLTLESTWDDFIQEKENIGRITVVILVDETFDNVELFTKNATEFVDDLNNMGLNLCVRVIYLDNETFESTERTNLKNVLFENKLTEYLENTK